MDITNKKKRAQASSRKYYEANREKVKKNCAAVRKKRREEWQEWKSHQCCAVCGETHPATFDFHHIDPATKTASVNELVRDGRFSRAYEEAKKCIVLCANCHRKLHYDIEEARKLNKKKKKGA